jgi:mono/diheme cytochrome c family protein
MGAATGPTRSAAVLYCASRLAAPARTREDTMLRTTLLIAALLLPSAPRSDDGGQMYGKKCLACHGLDGSGDKPLGKKVGTPDLRRSRLTLAEIERVIADGRGKMLPYKDRLTPEQITAIAGHVRDALRPAAGLPPPPPPPPAAPPAPAPAQ